MAFRRLLLPTSIGLLLSTSTGLLAGCGPAAPAVNAPAAGRPPYTAAELAAVVRISEVDVAPEGDEVVFVSDRSGAKEIWTATPGGGEPRQRTTAVERVSDPSYARDGSGLVFSMDHGGDERNDLWLLRKGAAAPERLTETPISETQARFSPDGKSLAFVADRDRPFLFNVEVMDLATRKTRQLTHETANVYGPQWSRDGRTLVALRTPDDQKGDLLVIDVAAGTSRAIAAPQANGMLSPIDFLPDGRVLSLATNARGFAQLAIVDLGSDHVSYVGPDDWDVEAARVAEDGSVIYSRNTHGESELAVASGPVPFATPPRVLDHGGVVTAIGIDAKGKRAVVIREASNSPAEMRSVELATGHSETIVPATLGAVKVEELAAAELREVTSFDGTRIDVYVWKPRVERLGSRPPCLVWVHGGPNGQTRGYFSPPVQLLVEAGFVVIAPNYRGSTGYGRAFEDLNNKDWGGGDLKDLQAAVEALSKKGEIDPARVAVAGGSYGGYMTLRAITAAPDFFKAGVDMFGMPDLAEDYKITENRFGTWYRTEMGDPVHDAALFHDRSPIHTLDRVTAPLLVLQGANDTNVPRAESDMVVKALRDRKHPVEYTVYPNEGHGFTRRENRLDAMSRTVAFLVRQLGAAK